MASLVRQAECLKARLMGLFDTERDMLDDLERQRRECHFGRAYNSSIGVSESEDDTRAKRVQTARRAAVVVSGEKSVTPDEAEARTTRMT